MEWWQMMGQAPTDEPLEAPGMAGMMQPMPDFEQYHRPVANPAELEKRMSGWQTLVQKFQTDPNLQRAFMVAGSMMMQPVQPGQTAMGNTANAAVTGMNAYTAGMDADRKSASLLRQEGREERKLAIGESDAAIRQAAAPGERELTGARTEGVKLDNQGRQIKLVADQATLQDQVDLSRIAVERARFLMDQGKADEAVKVLERSNAARKAFRDQYTLENMPLGQELDKADLTMQQLRAQIDNLKKTGRGLDAKAKQDELENEGLEAMSPAERAKIKRGQGGQSSAVVQQYNMWAEAYDRMVAADPNSPEVKGINRDQFAMKRLTEAKTQDAVNSLSALLRAGMDENDPLVVELRQQVSAGLQARRPGGAQGSNQPSASPSSTQAPPANTKKGGKPATGRTQSDPVPWPGDEGYTQLQSGTWYKDPNGQVRKKK